MIGPGSPPGNRSSAACAASKLLLSPPISVARVWPGRHRRASQTCYGRVLPHSSSCAVVGLSRQAPKCPRLTPPTRSCSLSELTSAVTRRTQAAMHHHPCNQESTSNCQSSASLAPVRFPVVSQIKPQAPHLVCHSVNSFKFQPCDNTPPGTQTLIGFPSAPEPAQAPARSPVGIVYSWD